MSSRTSYDIPCDRMDRGRFERAVIEATRALPAVAAEVAELGPGYLVAYFLVTMDVARECDDILGNLDELLEGEGMGHDVLLPAEIGLIALPAVPAADLPAACELFYDSAHSSNRFLLGAADRLCQHLLRLMNA